MAAIEQGFQQKEIQESFYRQQKDIEESKTIVVGINKFVSPFLGIPLLRLDLEQERKQIEHLTSFKKKRENSKVTKTLSNLEKVAGSRANTGPAFIECVEAYASIGEICDVLRKSFGVQKKYLVL